MTDERRHGRRHRIMAIGGGVLFVGSLLYFVASYGWRFDALPEPPVGTVAPILIDLGLFTLFALHHSLFARTGLKRWVRDVASPDLERSVYVWIASALFLVTCAYWLPIAGTAWRVTGAAAGLLQIGQVAGLVLAVYSATRLDTLNLAGVRQVFAPGEAPQILDTSGVYALVRHPIYFGWCLMVWLAPAMTGTRLAFAAISTLYLAAAVPFEERDLVRTFGVAYEEYRRRVRWRMIPFVF